jgi:predicted DNA-binding ribbon-helix-helix protein
MDTTLEDVTLTLVEKNRPIIRQPSGLLSRNLVIAGRRTSARLEPEMWAAFYDISRREHRTIHHIATLVNQNRPTACTLTAALRVFIMAYYRAAATEEGHARAGHGYGRVLYQNRTKI